MRSMISTMRLDAARLTSNGLTSVLIAMAMPMVLGIMMRKTTDLTLASGVVYGMIIAICTAFAMNLFFYEDQNDHRRMNGIVPSSRTAQVAGRYLLMAMIDIGGVVVYVLFVLISSLGIRSIAVEDVLVAGGIILGFSMLSQSLLMPLFYRFSTARILQIIYVVVAVCVVAVVIAVMSVLRYVNAATLSAVTNWMVVHILSSAALTALLATVIVVAAMAVSIRLSIGVYRRKDL